MVVLDAIARRTGATPRPSARSTEARTGAAVRDIRRHMKAGLQQWTNPLSISDLALERHIVLIRWLGVALCAVLGPFLHLGSGAPLIYACLLFITAYNLPFNRLVAAGRPVWLIRIYAYGLFDTAALSVMVAATGGLDSPLFPAYFLIVMYAGIRFGRGAALMTVAISSAGFAWLVVALVGGDAAAPGVIGLRLGFILLTAAFTGVLSDRLRAAEAALTVQLTHTQALQAAGAALTGTLDWSEVVQLVATQARQLVEADIAILEFHEVATDVSPPERVTDVLPGGAYLAKLILQQGIRAGKLPPPSGQITVHPLAEAADLLGPSVQHLPPASLLRAPILMHRRWVGDLFLVRNATSQPFASGDVTILETFLTQASLALEGARLHQRVQEQATTDPVTGLPNHRSLKERLDEEVSRARRHGRSLTVLMLDLDRFKAFNDTLGHAVGDAALRAIAAVLRSATRRGDVVARYGGEEFVVLLPETGAQDGAAIAERIRLSIAHCECVEGSLLPQQITVSIGVATFPDHAQERDALLQAADLTMYMAKHLGRNQVCTADELGTQRGAEALVAQLTQHLLISTNDWGPHVVTALERRFLRLAALAPGDQEAPLQEALPGQPSTVQLVTALAAAIDAKDHYTNGHSEHVASLASDLARATGASEELVELVRIGGQLHDIGKIGIPESILNKPDRLTEEEWAIMRMHPDIGARILAPISTLRRAIPLVRHHHERWDGQGYPHGLRGESIPLGARMICICDAYDTMTSDRPYRRALDHDEAVRRLRADAGTQFDPTLVEVFAAMRRPQPRVVDLEIVVEAAG